MYKKIMSFITLITLISSCSNSKVDYNIEKTIIKDVPFYIIDSKEDLIWLSKPDILNLKPGGYSKEKIGNSEEKWNLNYIQTKDIVFDAPLEENWTDDKKTNTAGFIPIGSKRIPFTGTYNGKGFHISNLYINRPEQDEIGLFSVLDSCKLDSISLVNVTITGKNNVGGLAGLDYKSFISNSYVNGDLTSKDFLLGGLVGKKEKGEIANSFFKGKLEAVNSYVGGIVGRMREAIITNSSTMGKISGLRNIGGIVGENNGDYNYDSGNSQNIIGPGSIYKCSSSASITGKREIGGIAGQSSIGSIFYCHFNGNAHGDYSVGGIIGAGTSDLISNCYNSGSINCSYDYTGGIVGKIDDIYAEYDASINESYSVGNITGEKFVGGIAGFIRGNIINSYNTGTIIGEEFVGGIVGSLEFSGIASNTYNIGEINGKKNIGAIAGAVSGMDQTTKEDNELLNLIGNKLKNDLGKVNAQVITRNEGYISYALVKNSYWNTSLTNQNNSIGKIRYFKNNKKTINGAKALTKINFLKANYFGKQWSINSKDAVWKVKKNEEFNGTLPFLNWQKVILQQIDDGKTIRNIIYNNKNKNLITKIGYLSSSNSSFKTNVDTLCVENVSIDVNSLKEIKPCSITSTNNKYRKTFAQDDSGKIWYGKIFR